MSIQMWQTSVQVLPSPSINGTVVHQKLLAPHPIIQYKTSTSVAGITGPKHATEPERNATYKVAGQDVYGHTHSSIFVADGHGTHGQKAALQAIEMHKVINVSPEILLQTPFRRIEEIIREQLVSKMLEADFPYSGSTFAFMSIIEGLRNRWALTVNIGDSEAFILSKDRMHMCSLAHTWDDLEIYNRYVAQVDRPRNVCYNRWNASKHRIVGPDGTHRPVMLYDIDHGRRKASVNQLNVEWVSGLWEKFSKPSIRHGTQSVRLFSEQHQNWGSTVLINGRARGQNMTSFGDCKERSLTKVPIDMIHIYIHEIEPWETVIGLVQSDGVSNSRTIEECHRHAYSKKNAHEYLKGIPNPSDDMSAGMIVSEPITKC